MRIACLFYYSTMRYYSRKFCRRVVDGCRRYAKAEPMLARYARSQMPCGCGVVGGKCNNVLQCSLATLARECLRGVEPWAVCNHALTRIPRSPSS